MEEIVEFYAGDLQLTGVLHRPEAAERLSREEATRAGQVGVVFANAGARGRLGSTFQYPYYARQLGQQGYASLRFDPHGIGDSEGQLDSHEMLEFYGVLQQGLFVDDLLAAIEEFRRRTRVRKVVLCGVCGGAITSLIAAASSPAVAGVVLLSVPVLLDSAEKDAEVISAGYAREYLLAAYGKKLLSLDAWRRLFSGESELDTIWSYSLAILRGGLDKARAALDPRTLADGLRRRLRALQAGRRKVTHTAERHPMFNDRFIESLDTLMGRQVPVLFVFGEGDAIRWHFEEHFQQPFWQDDPAYDKLCAVHYLPGCNHLFTLREWQDQALDLARPWLQQI